MTNILVLIATMTGTAEMIAEDIADAHADRHQFTLQELKKASVEQVTAAEKVLLVSSTYGEGEVPEPTIPFFNQLRDAKPNLSGLTYGAITLGDSVTYPNTFANGGRLWDALLTELGATRSGDLLVLDASDPSDKSAITLQWAAAWLSCVDAECAANVQPSQ